MFYNPIVEDILNDLSAIPNVTITQIEYPTIDYKKLGIYHVKSKAFSGVIFFSNVDVPLINKAIIKSDYGFNLSNKQYGVFSCLKSRTPLFSYHKAYTSQDILEGLGCLMLGIKTKTLKRLLFLKENIYNEKQRLISLNNSLKTLEA